MLVLLTKTKEMLNAVESFVFAKHVHEMMFVFRNVFESFHWIVGSESRRNFLWVVVVFILRGEAEISAKKWLVLECVVVGVGFTVLSKKIAFALVEVLILVFHGGIDNVLLSKNIKTASDKIGQFITLNFFLYLKTLAKITLLTTWFANEMYVSIDCVLVVI